MITIETSQTNDDRPHSIGVGGDLWVGGPRYNVEPGRIYSPEVSPVARFSYRFTVCLKPYSVQNVQIAGHFDSNF